MRARHAAGRREFVTGDGIDSAEVIENASKIWWDIRPSSRYPTLEMRVTDVCSRAADAIVLGGGLKRLGAQLQDHVSHGTHHEAAARPIQSPRGERDDDA